MADRVAAGTLRQLAGVGEATALVITQAAAGQEPEYLTRLRTSRWTSGWTRLACEVARRCLVITVQVRQFVLAPQLVKLVFGQTAPDPVPLTGAQRESETFAPHRAASAHCLGLGYLPEGPAGRGDREEQIRFGEPAGGGRAPSLLLVVGIARPEAEQL